MARYEYHSYEYETEETRNDFHLILYSFQNGFVVMEKMEQLTLFYMMDIPHIWEKAGRECWICLRCSSWRYEQKRPSPDALGWNLLDCSSLFFRSILNL